MQDVITCTVYRDNPYQRLLFSGIGDRYAMVKGDIDEALRRQNSDGPQILHIHWEEHIIRGAATHAEATALVDYFLKGLKLFRERGGFIVWTPHNIAPHEREWEDSFFRLRAGVAAATHRICVHNLATITLLRQQTKFDEAAPYLAPHPSYFGLVEPAPANFAAPPFALIFGKIRPYKALERFIEAFEASTLPGNDVTLQVCGEGLKEQSYAQDLRAAYADRIPGLSFDLRRVPDAEMPALFARATALILPYERLLNSGVLFMSMTLGTPVIAPRLPQVMEALPRENHAYLYDPETTADAISCFERLAAAPEADRANLRAGLLARAAYLRPERISRQLGALYDLAPRAVTGQTHA